MTQCISFQEINISAFHCTQWEVMLLWNLNATRHHNQWCHCNYHPHTCQPPQYKNLETSINLCIVRMSLSTMSESSPKITQRSSEMFPMSITACKNHTNFLPSIVQFDWLISDQLLYLLNIYQFDCSALHFPLTSAQIRALNPLLVLFSFLTSRKNEIGEKIMKKVTEGISWEIWCSNRNTGRFDEKLGDSRENWNSWQVCIQSQLVFLPRYAIHAH